MKKVLVVLMFSFVLLGCGSQENISTNTGEVIVSKSDELFEVLKSEYIALEIQKLQKLVDAGEITEERAAEALKQNITAFKKLNDGSIESILVKVAAMDDLLAEQLEKRIRENHPEMIKN